MTKLELGQLTPVLIENDSMDWMGLMQDRVGDAGLLQELQAARIDHLRARMDARGRRLIDDSTPYSTLGKKQGSGKPVGPAPTIRGNCSIKGVGSMKASHFGFVPMKTSGLRPRVTLPALRVRFRFRNTWFYGHLRERVY